jgi:hypothetical protein
MTVAKGRGSLLAFFVFFCIALYIYFRRARSGKPVFIRRITGLDAIDEAIGRCTEMGRPVHYTFGAGDFDTNVLASFDVLKYASEKAADMDTDIIVTNFLPETQPITEEIVSQGFVSQGKADKYKPDNVRFLSNNQNSYVAGIYGIFMRERPAANLMLGPFFAESMLIAEVGQMIGAIQIGGTGRTIQVPFFIAACDYTLIGEELFAAGAYISRNTFQVAALMAEEVAKYLAVALMVIGAIFKTMGVKWLADLINF